MLKFRGKKKNEKSGPYECVVIRQSRGEKIIQSDWHERNKT